MKEIRRESQEDCLENIKNIDSNYPSKVKHESKNFVDDNDHREDTFVFAVPDKMRRNHDKVPSTGPMNANKNNKCDDDESLDNLDYSAQEIQRLREKRRLSRDKIFDDESFDMNGSVDEEDPDYENDMGIKLEPFNLRHESRDGNFDDQGHFIFKKKNKLDRNFYILGKNNQKINVNINKKRSSIHEEFKDDDDDDDKIDNDDDDSSNVVDSWLDAVDQEDSFVTFKNEKDRENIRLSQMHNESLTMNNLIVYTSENIRDILVKLCTYLNPGETPTSALKRIHAEKNKETEKIVSNQLFQHLPSDNKVKSANENTAILPKSSEIEKIISSTNKKRGFLKRGELSELTKRINEITELCSTLMSEGKNVYFKTKEQIYEIALKIGDSLKLSEPPVSDMVKSAQYEYKWVNGSDKTLYGPFSSQQIMIWIQQGLINEFNPIEVRQYDPKSKIDYDNNKWLTFSEFCLLMIDEIRSRNGDS